MHIDVAQVQNETLLPEESIDTNKGLTTLVANISLIQFSTNLELFIADLLLLDLAVSGVTKNVSLYTSCIIFKTVPFALIVFFQKLICNFPDLQTQILYS